MRAKLVSLGLCALVLVLPPPAAAVPAQGEVARVLVTKSDRALYLFDSEGNMMRQFKVSLGRNPEGDKEEEGDGRTPEGRYVIDRRNENSDYYRSLHISYPAPKDLERAKKKGVSPGGAIFIHGQPNGKSWQKWKYNKKNDWTFGCIAVDDREIEEIWDLVPNGTPVVIVP